MSEIVGSASRGSSGPNPNTSSKTSVTMRSFSTTVSGVFSNGNTETLGQIAMSDFTNPPGLEKVGDSLYRATVNSGQPQVGTAGSGSRGLLTPGALEMSNVDLAQQFSQLIIAQRGFEANTKVITASNAILQALINLVQ